jgi:hypothetical protein
MKDTVYQYKGEWYETTTYKNKKMWWKLAGKQDCKYANRKRAESSNWMWLRSIVEFNVILL